MFFVLSLVFIFCVLCLVFSVWCLFCCILCFVFVVFLCFVLICEICEICEIWEIWEIWFQYVCQSVRVCDTLPNLKAKGQLNAQSLNPHCESGEGRWLRWEAALQMHSFRGADPQPVIPQKEIKSTYYPPSSWNQVADHHLPLFTQPSMALHWCDVCYSQSSQLVPRNPT